MGDPSPDQPTPDESEVSKIPSTPKETVRERILKAKRDLAEAQEAEIDELRSIGNDRDLVIRRYRDILPVVRVREVPAFEWYQLAEGTVNVEEKEGTLVRPDGATLNLRLTTERWPSGSTNDGALSIEDPDNRGKYEVLISADYEEMSIFATGSDEPIDPDKRDALDAARKGLDFLLDPSTTLKPSGPSTPPVPPAGPTPTV